MFLCTKKMVFCKIVTKLGFVTKLDVTKLGLHCTKWGPPVSKKATLCLIVGCKTRQTHNIINKTRKRAVFICWWLKLLNVNLKKIPTRYIKGSADQQTMHWKLIKVGKSRKQIIMSRILMNENTLRIILGVFLEFSKVNTT